MAVFDVLRRVGKVFIVPVPDYWMETLMAKIESSMVKGSVFDTDEFAIYNDLTRFGKHVPIDHDEEFADNPALINGI